MDTKNTYRVAEIYIGDLSHEAYFEFDYSGKHFEVQRFAANWSVPYYRDLIVNLRNDVDAFALSGLPPVMRVQGKSYVHRQYLDVMSMPSTAPLCDGSALRELAIVSAVSTAIERGEIDPKKGIFFPLALYYSELIKYLSETHRNHIAFGDAYTLLGTSWLAKPDDWWMLVAKVALSYGSFRDLSRYGALSGSRRLRRSARPQLIDKIRDYQYIFGDLGVLALLGDDLDFIRGKDVLLPSSHPPLEEKLRSFGPNSVRSLFPKEFQFHPSMGYTVLDAVLRLSKGRTAQLSLEEWQSLLSEGMPINNETRRYVIDSRPGKQQFVTRTLQRVRQRVLAEQKPDFAFVVHALSIEDIFKVPGLNLVEKIPGDWKSSFEKLAAKVPGFTYGHIRHIVSRKTNEEINGIIYALPMTPKMMREQDPESVYERIESLCHHAHGLGANMMGLGAYTKVVGDAGESINRYSPIPVTTGNSLSASATLWSVHDVVLRMGLLHLIPGTKVLDGTAMIIGATGSIGKVSAKLLSLVFRKLVLVAPRLSRLEDLRAEIALIAPQCEIVLTTNANELAPHSDVLVTATSALDQKVVDVELLKPGCVVCDCSRPLDFTLEDTLKRPDVLIIESGEVVLPGPVKLSCDIGLPKNVVYACLGETALLTLEKRFEPFTLGREIDYLKVKQIYKMAREHGVQLAAIRGHMGLITDKEIAITRELALKRRAGV